VATHVIHTNKKIIICALRASAKALRSLATSNKDPNVEYFFLKIEIISAK
jgi:hypothetical protein